MTTAQARARRTLEGVLEAWNGAPTDRLAPLLAPTYRGHTLGVPHGERDAAAYPAMIERYRQANPGVEFHVVEQFGADDRLVTRLQARRASLTTDGQFAMSHGINIARFDTSDRLAEEWAIWSPWQDQD